MVDDVQDVLTVLKNELVFIEKGGYFRSLRALATSLTPWLPTSLFQDSPTCINFSDPERRRPCGECLLMQFVPPERRTERVPCRHIPLSEAGETIHNLELNETQENMEEAVKKWLRATIKQLEEEEGKPSSNKRT
jgi:hypothetical protein